MLRLLRRKVRALRLMREIISHFPRGRNHVGRGSVRRGRDNSTSRPSLLDLGPDAMDVTEEVDYVQRRAEPPASKRAIETTESVLRRARTDAIVGSEMTTAIVNPINSHDSVERGEHSITCDILLVENHNVYISAQCLTNGIFT